MYGSRRVGNRNVTANKVLVIVRISKTLRYENPYSAIGTIKQSGLKRLPKGIYKDKTIGTWKA